MESRKNPLVSVVIPSYKRTVEYVSRAVESVLSQTYPNVEIIVIDDSTDAFEGRINTENYFRSLNAPNVVYLQNETNLGGSLSRNRGIEAAKGEYITFLDDDDEYKPEKIERQLRFMQENNLDMSFTNLEIYSFKGKLIDFREFSDVKSFDNDYLLSHHLQRHLTGTPTFMYKAEKLRETGCFEPVKIGQEFHLMLKTILAGLKIGYLPECHVKAYRHPDGGISGGLNKIIGEKELFAFKQKYFPRLNKKEQRFIRFRHHAVLAAGYKRNKMYFHMIAECFRTVFASPFDFLREGFKFVSKVTKNR